MKVYPHKQALCLLASLFALLLSVSSGVAADDARVLPAGVSQAYWDFYRYHPTTHRYNPEGDREALASPFDNAALDSSAIDILAPLDPAVGGTASVGNVAVDYEYEIDVLDIGYSYGLKENLSIGFHVPYYWIENNVDIDFNNSSANVGLNPGAGPPLIPVAIGGIPLAFTDVQNIVQAEYGFDEVDDWQREGIGDIELGAKYRVFAERDSALAITGGLRIPTGYEDHADKLNDVAWSFGNYALLFRLHYDYLLSNLWKPNPSEVHQTVAAAGDTLLNLTFRFDYMMPDDKIMRIGDTPEQVFTNNRERVDRELGDIFNLELGLRHWLTEALSVGAVYTYGHKLKDHISGDRGFNYSSLEKDTDAEEQIVILSVNYSTLAAYREQQSRAPMEFSLAYRERFSGKGPQSGQANPKLFTRWLVLGIDIYF